MIRPYAELDLWVKPDPEGKGFSVEASFGKRVARGKFEEPFSRQELDAFRKAVLQGRGPTVEARKLARGLGQKLFNAVFAGTLRDLWNRARHESGFTRGLRLRVRPSPEVAYWPWELLHSPKRHLALSTRTPVVRHIEEPATLPAPWVPWPLRILVVIPNPRGCDTLDGEQELKEIRESLDWQIRLRLVRVERLDPPTLDSLEKRLKHERFDVLHFVGHGSFHQDEGALLFEDVEGMRDAVDGVSLAGALSESIRLVVLNACEGACSSLDNPFAGVAQNLVSHGIPAVVAMQYPIEDSMAMRFAREFYAGIAEGRTVDWAVSRARHALRRGLDWTIPVLFLSSRSGRIVRLRPPWKWLVALAMVPMLSLGSWRWYRSLTVSMEIPPQTFVQPCPPVEGLDMEFVRIPAGNFSMGSTKGDEKPLHDITISRSFCLGVKEVTQQQWESIMGTNSVSSRSRGEDLPIAYVTWEEVQDFLSKVNKNAGRKIVRLPTEAEWEYAARGSGGLPAEFNCLHDQVDGLGPVGRLRPNRWGLYDMCGNVWEWVEDWYGPYPKESAAVDPLGPKTGTQRVRRGGGYDSDPKHCRPGRRGREEPGSRANNLGFRVLRELDARP
jgi:Sulfatase-modifying factor enzyme 1/CHAT domain